MKKKMRGMIIAAAAVVVLVAALVILMKLPANGGKTASSGAAVSNTAVVINQKATADIKTIQVKNQLDEYTVAAAGDSTYSIAALANIPVMDGAFTSMASSCANVTAKEMIDENPTDLEQYGLLEPRAQVTVTYADDTKLQLTIGDDAPLSAGTYVQVNGEKTVYLFTASKVSSFLVDKLSFVNTTITDAAVTGDDAPVLVSMTMEGTSRTEPLVLVPADTSKNSYASYDVASPKQKPGDSEATSAVVASVDGLTATSVVAINPTAEQLAEYGLAQPYSKVTAVYDKKTVTLLSSEPQKSLVYIMNTAKNVVYQMAAPTTDSWITAQYKDMISSLVYTPMINTLKTLTVTTADKSYVFDLTTANDADNKEETTATYNGAELDSANFKKYYQNVICAMHREFTTEQPTGTPVLTYKYEYTDASKSADVVAFYKAANGKVFVTLNGVCESYEYQNYVDKMLQDSEKVIANQDINTVL